MRLLLQKYQKKFQKTASQKAEEQTRLKEKNLHKRRKFRHRKEEIKNNDFYSDLFDFYAK
jgi:hypothetical protein